MSQRFPPKLDPPSYPVAQTTFRELINFTAFHRSRDFASKLAYLHNLYGIAMVQRFRGDTLNACEDYRLLARHVEATISDFRQGSLDISGTLTDQLALPTDTLDRMYVMRSINTQERLGDCNLFGDPGVIDLKEAVDDFRRARNLVHLLTGISREIQDARLLYKTALALSLPSPVQDTEMAIEMCQHADEIFRQHEDAKITNGLYWTLGKLTTAIVGVLNQAACLESEEIPCTELAETLRAVILECRDTLGQYPHRDQLEIMLFASKVLLQNAAVKSRFQHCEDADLLLSLCRLGLGAYRYDEEDSRSESRAYLRPYYDAVMLAKLELPNRHHVLDLLEIQSEVTTGSRFMKPEDARPVLALYALQDESYLLMDLPGGVSKVFPLTNIYDNATILGACYGTEESKLTLPGEVLGELTRWRKNALLQRDGEVSMDADIAVAMRWIDPVRHVTKAIDTEEREVDTVVSRTVLGGGPFQLPHGFRD